jgi:hypothetical protein
MIHNPARVTRLRLLPDTSPKNRPATRHRLSRGTHTKHLPATRHKHLPATRHKHLPATRHKHLPATRPPRLGTTAEATDGRLRLSLAPDTGAGGTSRVPTPEPGGRSPHGWNLETSGCGGRPWPHWSWS